MDSPAPFDRSLIAFRLKRRDPELISTALTQLDSIGLLQDILDDTTRSFTSALVIGGDHNLLSLLIGHYGITQCTVINPISILDNDEIKAKIDVCYTDEEDISCANSQFDIIINYFNLQTINALPQYLMQCHQHLSNNGLMLSLFFGGTSLTELRQSTLNAEMELGTGAGARISPMIDVKDAGRLLQMAGFEDPVSDIDHLQVMYEHPLQLMHDIKKFGESNALSKRPKHMMTKTMLHHICDTYIKSFGKEDGSVPATIDVITMTGWKSR